MQFWRKHKIDIILALLVFVVAVIPRVANLGVFLTADEKNWIGRSYEFVRAFKDVRLNDMLQTTHPGVTALWLIGVSVTLKMFISHIPFSFQTLPSFIYAAQLPIALVNSLAVPVIYLFLRVLHPPKQWGWIQQRAIPLLAAAFIALDPFLIGYSRVAHVDALLGSFLFLAVLATIIYVQQGYSRKWLVASAVLSALAILTKAPAVFMIPFFWLSVYVWGEILSRQLFLARLRDFIIWLSVVGILFVVIWPVFIGVPDLKGNVHLLQRDLSAAAVTPHDMTEDYTLNPWHYPAALITRTTPIALALALFSIGYLLFRRTPREIWLLVGYIFSFTLMMTLGAKKGDRYILPVFFAIDVVAAWGLIEIMNWFKAKRLAVYAMFLMPIAYLIFVVASYHPYEIAYANPLFPDNLSQELGWGEGLDQVGQWLNEHDPNARVAAWYNQELGAYTTAVVLPIGAHEEQAVKYVVLYRNMFGRAPDHPANDYIDEYYKKREPVFVAYVHGKPFAWVYEKHVYAGITGELLPSRILTQAVPVKPLPVAGVEVLAATYSGKATLGEIFVELLDESETVMQAWHVPVKDLEDDTWRRLLLTAPRKIVGKVLQVRVQATGTVAGNAPTIRRDATGMLAVRLLYDAGGQLANEEYTKLLPAN